jgi:hypothetical protein
MTLQFFLGCGRFVEIQQPGWLVWIVLEVLRSHVGGGVFNVVFWIISLVDVRCSLGGKECKCGLALVALIEIDPRASNFHVIHTRPAYVESNLSEEIQWMWCAS